MYLQILRQEILPTAANHCQGYKHALEWADVLLFHKYHQIVSILGS
jgi:hypothetical protein